MFLTGVCVAYNMFLTGVCVAYNMFLTVVWVNYFSFFTGLPFHISPTIMNLPCSLHRT